MLQAIIKSDLIQHERNKITFIITKKNEKQIKLNNKFITRVIASWFGLRLKCVYQNGMTLNQCFKTDILFNYTW